MKLASSIAVLTIAVAATAVRGQIPPQTSRIEQDHASVPQLVLGEPLEGNLPGGQSHEYRLVADAGRFLRVSVEQRSINVVVTVFEPDGKQVVETNTTGSGDVETASFVTDLSGEYRIRVRSPESTAPTGRYQIKLDDGQPATDRHRSRVAAERAFSEGMALYYQQADDSTRRAIQKFEDALMYWRAVDDRAAEAKAL
jgi:hypothetical protein